MQGWKIAYDRYIRSNEWKAKRQEAFALYGRKCKYCHKTKNLHVHHKTYINLFHERMEDLEIACEMCHMAIHARVPPTPPKPKNQPYKSTPAQIAKRERKKELSRLIAEHNAEVRARKKHKKGEAPEADRPGSLLRYMSNNRGPV